MMGALLLSALLQVAGAAVESPKPAASPGPTAPAPAASASFEYQVGPGDLLEVTVYDDPGLSRIPTVQTNGAISYPLLGEVQVAGLTVAEIQKRITDLLARDYLVNPQVEVKVREYQSQSVSVVGEVNAPGRKPLRGRTRLIDVLIEAGGFTARASGEVLITRREGVFEGGRNTMTVRISNSSTLTPQDQINLDLPIRNGDIVTASPKYFVTVDGEVNRPGRYAIEADLTVTGVVSLAGGLTRFGSNDVKIKRTDPGSGSISLLEVDLKDVRNGKRPDVPLQANDVVSVPRRVF
jgi:polysaccharide export outer membrane protein